MKLRDLIAFALWAALLGCAASAPVSETPTDALAPEPTEPLALDAPTVTSWIVQTADNMTVDEIEEAAGAVIPGALVVESLFPDAEDLNDMFIVTAGRAYTESEAFDIRLELRDLPAFSDAMPNLSVHEPELPRAAAAACKDGATSGVPSRRGWSLETMHVAEAWALAPEPGGRSRGEGVTICHPDSGWAEHVEYDLEAIDVEHGIDLIDQTGDGKDPLDYSGNPGHGTATGSVLVSRGDVDASGNNIPEGGVTGVAPKARVIPIRTIKSVVRFLDSDTARAVDYARRQDCDVVSMSLGGHGFFGLKKVIEKAVEEEDKIVVSAAGNCVGWIVAPAKYDSTVAAAASNWNNEPWKGSSKGRAVTLTAPGEGVWIARRERDSTDTTLVEHSNGTSFATTAIAGAAANWVAFHGRERLDDAKGEHSLAALFRFAIERAVTVPDGWDTRSYGPGILNLKKLLEVDINQFPKDQPRSLATTDTPLFTLANTIDRDTAATRALLRYLFGDTDADQLAADYGPELERMAATRPAQLQEILNSIDQRLPRSGLGEAATRGLSSRMRAAMRQ